MFAFELYEIQAAAGRFYLHEHPQGASSWTHKTVTDFCMRHPDAELATMHMCAYDMKVMSKDGQELGYAMKPTSWLTNAPAIAEQLRQTCPGGHHHEVLLDGKARQCQVYPKAVCEAIVRGLKVQLERTSAELASLDLHTPVVPDASMGY